LLSCSTTSPSGKAAKSEAKAALEQAIDRLPRDYQIVVRLYDIEGHPVEDLASTMKRSAGAVFMLRARAHRALGRLLGAPFKYFSDPA
jgi:DNA-directed RNA polymerase specialized sigma24 family protein